MKFAFAQRGLLGDPDFLPDGEIEKVIHLFLSLCFTFYKLFAVFHVTTIVGVVSDF